MRATKRKSRIAIVLMAVAAIVTLGVNGLGAGAVGGGLYRESVETSQSAGLTASTTQLLATNQVFVEPALPIEARISSSFAEGRATEEFSSLLHGMGPDEVGLVLLSIPDLGPELESDPTKPSRIAPLFVARPAWAILYRDVELPIFGQQSEEVGNATSYHAPFIVFIDAVTGEFLDAESL